MKQNYNSLLAIQCGQTGLELLAQTWLKHFHAFPSDDVAEYTFDSMTYCSLVLNM